MRRNMPFNLITRTHLRSLRYNKLKARWRTIQTMFGKSKALYRLNGRRIRRFWQYIRYAGQTFPLSEMRGLFSWTWGFAWFFLATAVAIVAIGTAVEPFHYLFNLGRIFFALGLVSVVGWWLTSEQLEKLEPRVTKKQKKHGEKISYVKYRIFKWGFTSVMVLVASYALLVTGKIELSRELSLDHGWLIPAGESDPPNNCDFQIRDASSRMINQLPDTALRVFLGHFVVSYSTFPHNIFTVNGKNPLILNRDESGRIALTMDILDREEKIVVRFENGHFTVNPNARLEMNRPDRSSLIVRDNYGNEVLNVRYMNKKSVVIAALLQYSQARPVRIARTKFADSCIGDAGSTGINFDSPR